MNPVRAKMVSMTLSAIIFVVIVAAAIIKRDTVIQAIGKADTFWLIAGAICYGFNYFFRSYRLWLYAHKAGLLFPVYLKITGIHGFNSYFLPMRSGDLTLPFLLRLHAKIPLALGGRILVRARVLDINSLGYLLFLATLLSSTTMPVAWRLIMLFVAVAFILLPYVTLYFIRHDAFILKSWLHKMVGGGKPAYPAFTETVVSLTIWFWIGCTIYCVIRSLNIPLSFYDVWLLVAIQLPLQIIPIQGLANSGNHEAGWVLALGLFGVPPSVGLSLALASHAVFILYAILLGVLAIILPSKISGMSETQGLST